MRTYTPDEAEAVDATPAASPDDLDEETAKWIFRIAFDGVAFDRLVGRIGDDDYDLQIERWATCVACGMWASGDADFPAEFVRELSGRHPREERFLIAVADRATRLYTEWTTEDRAR